MTFCKPTIFQGTIRTLLFVAFLSLACPTNGEQWQEDALKKEGVIPEIIDSVKAYPLNITYGDGVEVKYGNLIKPTLAGSAPTKVNWDADPNKLYVLVMTDPDAPARGAKLLGEVNHWMIVNIPGSDLDLSKGDTLADYGPPGPPRGTGPHRYVFVVYEQQGKFVPSPKYSERLTVTALAKRIKFSVKEFAKEFNLGEPVAANFFLSEYTPPRNVFPRIIPASSAKNFSSTTNLSTKIAVLGACGGIGQPLSLLLKMNPRVHELAMYDIQYPQGVASDLSHVPSPCAVQGFGAGQIMEALKDAKIVVCAAGSPRKAGVTREEQFRINSKVVKELAKSCSIMNPHAIYCIVTNPINSTVPLFCEIFKRAGVLNEGKILGISNLGMMRASSYIAKEKGWKPSSVSCPVIGGHSGITIVPIISQCKPDPQLSPEQVKLVTHEIREAGAEIVAAKKGAGTVALSIAWSAHKFIDSLLRAVDGEKGIVETAYVKGSVAEVNYFSNPVELGPEGVVKNLGLPQLNDYEKSLLNDCIPALTQHIRAGEGAATDSRPNLVPNAMVL